MRFLAAVEGALLLASLVILAVVLRAARRNRAVLESRLTMLRHLADERAVALDYLVRARVVDYVYNFVGYRISIGGDGPDEIHRVLVFNPPQNKDIICKRITLVEGQSSAAGLSVRDFGFEASVSAPLPNLVDGDAAPALDPHDESAWQFESHPWALDLPSESEGEVRTILVFTPMISDTRRLVIRYRWPRVFPELHAGSPTARGHFSTLKHARVLEFAVRLPSGAGETHLTVFPPGERQPAESIARDDGVVCTVTDAPRGTYRYVLKLSHPLAS
jgi:hypothetical protein